MFLESEARPVLTNIPPSVSRLFTQFEILNISQPYGTLRPVTGIALLLLFSFTIDKENQHIAFSISSLPIRITWIHRTEVMHCVYFTVP
jgi:hypothetical protein